MLAAPCLKMSFTVNEEFEHDKDAPIYIYQSYNAKQPYFVAL